MKLKLLLTQLSKRPEKFYNTYFYFRSIKDVTPVLRFDPMDKYFYVGSSANTKYNNINAILKKL